MKKRIPKKLLSLLLAVLLLLPCFSCFVFAAPEKNDDPVIFIAGFASTPIVDPSRGKQAFPPSFDDFRPVLKKYAGDVLRALIRKNYAVLEEPLTNTLLTAFDMIRCDENGDPLLPATTTSYVYPTGDELRAKYDPVQGYTAEDNIYYSFDWRLDLKTLAEDLHSFIEYVLEETGAQKVKAIGSSMGGCVLATYMDMYGTEYLSSALFLSAAFQGATIAGEPMIRPLTFNSANLTAFVSSVLGTDVKAEILNTLIDSLYQLGVMDRFALTSDQIVGIVSDGVYQNALRYIFGRIPGFWALVPYEMYDEAKTAMTKGIVSDAFYEKIDFYHEIQGRIPEIIQSEMDAGVQVSIVSKYGIPVIPAVQAQQNMTDMVVDVRYSSLGADCAPVNAPFTDRSGEYVSSDGYIDASTCAFPETTWFLKNVSHTAHPFAELTFLNTLLTADSQPTVDAFADYPRFLIQTPDGRIVPLTPETDRTLFILPAARRTGFGDTLKRLWDNFFRILNLIIRLAGQSIKGNLPAVPVPAVVKP